MTTSPQPHVARDFASRHIGPSPSDVREMLGAIGVQSLDQGHASTHSSSHKVVRVELDEEGHAVRVQDFVTGLALATDVLFGPDGAMYIADAEMVYRVSFATAADLEAPFPPTPEDLAPVLPVMSRVLADGGGVEVADCAPSAVAPAARVPARRERVP